MRYRRSELICLFRIILGLLFIWGLLFSGVSRAAEVSDQTQVQPAQETRTPGGGKTPNVQLAQGELPDQDELPTHSE